MGDGMRRGISTWRTISSIVNVRNARCAMLEARFVSALSKVIPITASSGMTLDETFSAFARTFPHANRRAVASFSAVAPVHLAESSNVTVRAVCARVARGEQLKRALRDASRHVREAAISRLVEVGEVLPDAAPEPMDLSDEYYASIANRLINDFPDRNGDWVSDAVAATVRSYRTSSGVQLDAEKLLDAVSERLAELNEEGPCGPLDEAIEALGRCDAESPTVRLAERMHASVRRAQLPIGIRKRILSESGSLVFDAPSRVSFRSQIGVRERAALRTIVATVTRELHGVARVSWVQDGERTATFTYGEA